MKKLTPEDVISAYRFILNREPESEHAIRAHQNVETWRKLREIMLSSEEFQSQQKWKTDDERFQIARFFDVQSVSVETDCSPLQESKMYARIAQEWKKFGETEVYHSVLTQEDYRGEKISEDKKRDFFESGKITLEELLNFLRRNGIETKKFKRALDFGCGVGRLSAHLSKYAAKVIGVDVSPGHLAEAHKNIEQLNIGNVELLQIKSIDDLSALSDFDLVISIIVLQHNPPPLMAIIFRRLLRSLCVGGVAVIQMPTYIHNQRFRVEEYLKEQPVSMEMNALPQRKIFEIISEEGCRPLEIREDNATNMGNGLSHTFALIKER